MELEVKPVPNMVLADYIFRLRNEKLAHLHSNAREKLMEGIARDKMAPLYEWVHSLLPEEFPWDQKVYDGLAKECEKLIEGADKKLANAQEMNGEHEVMEALRERAEVFAQVGDKKNALQAYEDAIERTTTFGTKIDLALGKIRICMFFTDWPLCKKFIEEAEGLVEEGGDWDRRNRFRVYQGLMYLYSRNFTRAADLLLDSMSTFSCSELLSHKDLIKYAVIAGSLVLSRVDMKNRIIDSSEVISVLPIDEKLASLESCVNCLYLCDYAGFFNFLEQVKTDHLLTCRLLAPHFQYYVCEMRRRAYSQILESYRSLSIKSMANAFKVSPEFLDNDLVRFISEKKISCVIDRVNQIIETNRPNQKNLQYHDLVKQGDMLLNKIQKYQATISALK